MRSPRIKKLFGLLVMFAILPVSSVPRASSGRHAEVPVLPSQAGSATPASRKPLSTNYGHIPDLDGGLPTTPTVPEPFSVLFADNFDTENGGLGELNYFGFRNWNVPSGSVDLIGNGFADFIPGNGLYIDLDGTTSAGGTLETKTTFTLPPAVYRLEFSLAGSQLGEFNAVIVGLGDVYSETFGLEGSAPLTTITRDIIVSQQTSGKIVFQQLGNNNIGNLLDNVRLSTDLTGTRLFNISPGHGGNAGVVTANIEGINFPPGPATVRLSMPSQPDIMGSDAAVVSPNRLAVTFDLTGAAPGARDLVVTFSDGNTQTLQDAFTIDEGGSPHLWIDVIGRSLVRSGQQTTYQIFFGNSGNVNWDGLAFFALSVPVGTDSVTVKYNGVTVGDFEPLPAPPSASAFSAAAAPTSSQVGIFNLPWVPPSQQGAYSITFRATQSGDVGVQLFQIPASLPSTQPGITQNPIGRSVENLFNRKFSELGIDIPQPSEDFKSAVIGAAQQTILNFFKEFAPKPDEVDDFFIANISTNPALVLEARRRVLDQLEAQWAELVEQQRSALDQLELPQNRNVFNSILRDNWRSMESPVEFSLENIKSIQTVVSNDPNDKVGSLGVGQPRYLSGDEPLRYVVYFENVATATAPAQQVVVSDQFDVSNLDLNTFSLGPIAFGDRLVVPPQGLKEFSTNVDLRPDANLIVKIDAHLNVNTGLLTCSFTSSDPDTGQPPDDPLAGFLPPNHTSPEGEGSIVFTVRPKTGLATGTEIRNHATIVFDENAPVQTPEWFNTLDNTKPTSQVLALTANQCADFEVNWAGSDVGSDILDYTVFVSENGGPFTAWLRNTVATGGTFTGQTGKTYAFYSVARDRAGNVEVAPAVGDASTTVADAPATVIVGASVDKPSLWPPNHQMVDVTVNYDTAQSCHPNITCALSVTSSEPINGTGDGDTAPDWEIVDGHHVRLRAERSGKGNGRTYRVTITCTNSGGHSSIKVLTVGVPKSRN